jgi:ubiquinone/menaquinone biosynthesis C-methylase UbiE
MVKDISSKQFNALARRYEKTERFFRWKAPESVRNEIDTLNLDSEAPLKILILGAGTGKDAELLQESFPNADIHGCDLSEHMLSIAVGNNRIAEENVKVADLSQSFPYQDDEFDLVICCGTSEYLGEPERLINEMARVAAPGGHVVSTFRQKNFTNLALHAAGALQNPLSFIPGVDAVAPKTTTTAGELTTVANQALQNTKCSAPYAAYYQALVPMIPYSGPPVTYLTFSGQKPS